jgi:ubiquinone biosynthesis O-methyltransferase
MMNVRTLFFLSNAKMIRSPKTNMRLYSSISFEEVQKFSRASKHWWDETGEFGLLHSMNPVRVRYIRDRMRPLDHSSQPLNGTRCLDVGCGGGLLSESLARLGASVTAVDASPENIGIAKAHLQQSSDRSLKIDYQCTTAEELASRSEKFDAVLSLEVIEHVQNQQEFVANLCHLVKPNGLLFVSTINRTIPSYVGTILVAEYLMGIVPKGTHDYTKYVRPQELSEWIERAGGSIQDVSGNFNNSNQQDSD